MRCEHSSFTVGETALGFKIRHPRRQPALGLIEKHVTRDGDAGRAGTACGVSGCETAFGHIRSGAGRDQEISRPLIRQPPICRDRLAGGAAGQQEGGDEIDAQNLAACA